MIGGERIGLGEGGWRDGREAERSKEVSGMMLSMFDVFWVGSLTGNFFNCLMYKFGGWSRTEE